VTAENLDLIAGWASLIMTLFVFSYLLADNFLYRITVHILIGSTAAYAAIIAVENVIIPWVELTILSDSADDLLGFRILGIIPFLLGVSLLLKNVPRFASLSNLGMAVVIGVGTGVAVVGAVAGTIVPLVRETGEGFEDQNIFSAIILTVGTITTLVYFQYMARRRVDGTITRSRPMLLVAGVGRLFLAITFGAIYAGAVITSLSVFSGVIDTQLTFLLEQIG
jgi:hypothetical protein